MASNKKSIFETASGKRTLNYAYSLGAAVVILGALFKIMHWPGANIMLMVGMGTEVIIFVISAFEPQHDNMPEYHWERVYPELADDGPVQKSGGKPLTQQLDKMLSDAKVGPELINSLGKGFTTLGESVSKMNDLTGATVAANDFSKNAQSASSNISSFAQAAASATNAVSQIGATAQVLTETAGDAAKLKENLASLNKNLASLSQVYGNMLSAMKA
jgi:gliding motility-associated protein GldL